MARLTYNFSGLTGMIAQHAPQLLTNLPRLLLAVLVTSVVGWLGCGGGQPAPEPQAASPAPAGQAASPVAAAPGAAPVAPAAVDPDRKETKWIGKIPYDVFYDQPLTIAANTTGIGGTQQTSVTPNQPNPAAEAGSPNMPTPAAGTPAAGAPAAAASASVDWAKVMPMEMLMTELKTLRTQLQGNLQTVATFNRGIAEISNDAAMLAGLVGIIENHSEETNWKPNAHIVRELAYQVYSNAEGSGRAAYEKTQLPFEQLCTIMDGGNPPAVDAEPKAPFADYVYLSEIMKWLDKRFSDLKSNVNTEARLKEDPLAVERRLRMMVAFGRMMGTESYDSADEKKYQEFVSMFVDGGTAAVDSAKAGDFEGFQAALNKVQTSCGECHQQYRGSDSGF